MHFQVNLYHFSNVFFELVTADFFFAAKLDFDSEFFVHF